MLTEKKATRPSMGTNKSIHLRWRAMVHLQPHTVPARAASVQYEPEDDTEVSPNIRFTTARFLASTVAGQKVHSL